MGSINKKSDNTKNSIEQSIIKKINEKKVNLIEASEINLDEDIEENEKTIKKDFLKLLKDQPALFQTLKPTYKYSYSKKIIKKYKRLSNLRIIGMGGSVLGSEAIYDFLKPKIKKKNYFC